ncbi:glycosyltransferase family 4 protein [uncultured Thiohalocapsa sp.]|uniref:glycosyltransferase family 4 protein n=1 Tax=uncultured Thiohalocapsa sp. TaxID=768990 RepID=UPI0025DA5FE4|nr:glycosyltransferase family 4 protein [uncultured Thiohalocapsa sp.]
MAGRILSLCAFDVLPPASGGALRVAAINQGLAALGWQVTQYIAFPSLSRRLSQGRSPMRSLRPGWREHYARGLALKLPAWLLNRLGLPPLAADLSPRCLLGEPALRRLLTQADVVIAEHPWLFRPVFRLGGAQAARWVLDAHNLEYPLYAARGGGRLHALAARRVRALEAFAFRHADISFVVSNEDAVAAHDRYGVAPGALAVAPNGVDCTTLRPVTAAVRQQRKRMLGLGDGPVVLFVGANWPPNVEAARAVLQLAAALADTPLLFVIAGAVGDALAHDPRPARVRLTGAVDEMRPWLEAADLALNPMRSGGGSNIKLLEYLACGLAVISTPFGARGLDLVPGREAVIVPLAQFPAQLRAAAAALQPGAQHAHARRGETLRALGHAGRRAVVARFDWSAIVGGIHTALTAPAAGR